MAGSLAILGALARSVWRDLRTFGSVGGNNLLLFMLVVMYQQTESGAFFLMILSVLLLGPLSGDPFRKIPRDRLALWPLSGSERVALRFGSLALSPVVWIAVVFLFWSGGFALGMLLLGGAIVMQAAGGAWEHWKASRPQARRPALTLPNFPGRLGGLIQKDLRQMLTVLDCYAALVLVIGGVLYRVFGAKADPDAFMILALVAVIAISTYAQALFGLDLPWGMARYRVLPLRGFEILLAKDIAFLCVSVLLVAPLALLPGLAGALVALAVGHHASVINPTPQLRWRFTGGTLWPSGMFQVVPLVAVGVATGRGSVLYLGAAFVAYLVSLWYYGRAWDRGISAL